MFHSFFVSKNLVSPEISSGFPWGFCPTDETLEAARKQPKRPHWLLDPKSEWNVYSAVRGLAPNLRVSGSNPAAGLRGLVADYDMTQSVDVVRTFIDQLKPEFHPNFIEISLGKKIRVVWTFERELLVRDNGHCEAVIKTFFEKMGVCELLAGFDPKSSAPTEMWTNGGRWHDVKAAPLSWDLIFGVALDASRTANFGQASEVPLDVIAEEVKKRFPNRWRGEFTLNALGVRFWDGTADNETGCQVKPDGMLCFTGNSAFVKWAEIFGPAWVNEQRALNLGKAAGEIYYDGKRYWEFLASKWRDYSREDVITGLKTRGISSKASKGLTSSDIERVLTHIKQANAIDGAAPLINYKPGIQTINGEVILNTYTHRVLEPSPPGTGKPENFPWIWKIVNSLFDPTSSIYVVHFWLAWLQRFYRALYLYERSRGQAVFIFGPKNNGKSLISERIVRPLIGGKASNPYELFMGKTTFSDDVCSAPLLILDDQQSPETEAERRKFFFSVKSWVVSPSHTYHPKFNKRSNLPWCGRILINGNDDASSVGMIPEVNQNTVDKTMFFASRPFPEKWPPTKENEERIERELPFFARFLLDGYTPPDHVIGDARMGVKSFHDARILRLSQQQIHAYNLIELLVQWCQVASEQWDKSEYWEGTPTALLSAIGANFETLAREWTVNKIANALALFSSRPDSGITLLEGGRSYRICRRTILGNPPDEQR